MSFKYSQLFKKQTFRFPRIYTKQGKIFNFNQGFPNKQFLLEKKLDLFVQSSDLAIKNRRKLWRQGEDTAPSVEIGTDHQYYYLYINMHNIPELN